MKKYVPVFPMCPPYIHTYAYTQKSFYTVLCGFRLCPFPPVETEEALKKSDVSLEEGLGRPGRAGIAVVYVQWFPGWKLSCPVGAPRKGLGRNCVDLLLT